MISVSISFCFLVVPCHVGQPRRHQGECRTKTSDLDAFATMQFVIMCTTASRRSRQNCATVSLTDMLAADDGHSCPVSRPRPRSVGEFGSQT